MAGIQLRRSAGQAPSIGFAERWAGPGMVLALLATATLASAATDGVLDSHAFYLPVVAAAALLGWGGTLLTTIACAAVLHPSFALGGPVQTLEGWTVRVLLLLLAGLLGLALFAQLRQRASASERSLKEVTRTCRQMLHTLSTVVALRDEDTGAHCERVAGNARLVGAKLGLSVEEREQLYWAGLLHDLGKVAVPEGILQKPGPLTPAEMAVVRKHPEVGARLVDSLSPDFVRIAEGIRSHHEQWDGGGYPRGLAGEEIPLFGRILAVVDAFEALVTERCYRDALPTAAALAYLSANAGTRFEPRVVVALDQLEAAGRLETGPRAATDPGMLPWEVERWGSTAA